MKTVICRDRNSKQYEVPVEELKLRPSIYGIIVKDGAVLLSKQWDGYDFPGGGVDLGEDIKDALIREVKEETGLDAKIGKIVACESSFYKKITGECLHSILIYYLCEITGGELSIENIAENEKSYISMPEWIPLDQIGNIRFYNSIDSLKVIRQALELRN